MSTGIEQVTRAVQETNEAAGQMLQASDELSRLAEALRAEVDRFLREVRNGK